MKKTEREADGSVLILVMLMAVIVTGMGLTGTWLASTATHTSGNQLRRQEALGAAQAGLRQARALLNTNANWGPLLAGSGCVATSDDPARRGMVLCDGATPLENVPLVPAGSATATSLGLNPQHRYTIYVRNDAAEYRWCNGVIDPGETVDTGDCNNDGATNALDAQVRAVDGDRRVVVRVEGHGRDGVSTVAIEAVIGSLSASAKTPRYSQAGVNSEGTNSTRAYVEAP